MTAAIPGPIAEPTVHEPTVHEWLDLVCAETGAPGTPQQNSLVATICAAAVDSLEIAASLEASGVSRQVVTARYAQRDVFALADELWTKVAFRPVPVRGRPMWRVGNPRDLGRGALYAAPALMLLALTRAVGLALAWWALPLAISWGWALGQVTAYAGYSLRTRQNSRGERVALGCLMIATIISTGLLGFVAELFAGGGLASVLATAGVTTYMVSSAILLLNDQEVLAAVMLAPGAVITGVVLAFGTDSISPLVATLSIGGSALATLVAAVRYTRLTPLKAVSLVPGDLRASLQHLFHGLMCGIALTMVAIFGGQIFIGSGSTALFALPLLLTLGIMEWQLRSFRAGVEKLAATLVSLDEFAPRSWALFRRALLWYILWTAIASVGVAAIVQFDQHSPPYALLGAQLVLGAAFYVDLTLVSLARLDLVTRFWSIGLVCGLLWCAAGMYTTSSNDSVFWTASIVATTVTLVALLIASPGVVSASMSH